MLVRALSLSLMLAPLFSRDSFACARARSHLMIALALALARSRSRLPRAPSRDTPHASRLTPHASRLAARSRAHRASCRRRNSWPWRTSTAGGGVSTCVPRRAGCSAPSTACASLVPGAAFTRATGPPMRLILGLPTGLVRTVAVLCYSQEWEGCGLLRAWLRV